MTDGPRIAASAIASGRNGITRNHSVSRIRTPPNRPPKKPAVIPTTEPITTASTVAARPTRRLIRDAQMNWSMTGAAELVGAEQAELGRAREGRVLSRVDRVQLACVGEQRRAPSAIAPAATRIASPIIPGVCRRYWPHAREAARRRRVHAIRRGEVAAAVLTSAGPAGRGTRSRRSAIRLKTITDALKTRKMPLEHRQVGSLQRLEGREAEPGPREDRLDGDRS